MITSDYLADGGDNLSFLRGEKRINFDIFIRDLFLDYLSEQTQMKKVITSTLDGRITIQ